MSANSYIRLFSFIVRQGKCSSLVFKANSTSSGEPYRSSNLSHIRFKALSGYAAFAALILNANLVDSGPRYFASKSTSSNGVTPSSSAILLKLVFHVTKTSGRSVN